MPDAATPDIAALQARRQRILDPLAVLDDLRLGSLVHRFNKC